VNEIVATVLTLFVLFFLVAQIRFIRRLINRRKNNENIPGGLLLAEVLSGCFFCMECCGDIDVINYTDSESDAHLEKFSGKAPDETEIKRALKDKKGTIIDSLSEEEKYKIKDLISKRQKTSLMYISNITLIPKERIITLLLDNSDFDIENEYIINKKLVVKDELTDEICPECNNPFKSSRKYCSTCGFEFKLR